MRARARVCVCACVCACMCVRACVRAHLCMRICIAVWVWCCPCQAAYTPVLDGPWGGRAVELWQLLMRPSLSPSRQQSVGAILASSRAAAVVVVVVVVVVALTPLRRTELSRAELRVSVSAAVRAGQEWLDGRVWCA